MKCIYTRDKAIQIGKIQNWEKEKKKTGKIRVRCSYDYVKHNKFIVSRSETGFVINQFFFYSRTVVLTITVPVML